VVVVVVVMVLVVAQIGYSGACSSKKPVMSLRICYSWASSWRTQRVRRSAGV